MGRKLGLLALALAAVMLKPATVLAERHHHVYGYYDRLGVRHVNYHGYYDRW